MMAELTADTSVQQAKPDAARIATAFMLGSLGAMVATLGLALLVQNSVGYLLCASLYLVKVLIERRYGITSPLSLTLLSCYAALFGGSIAGLDFTGYAGVIVFATLSLVVGALLAIGRPFTSFYSHGKGDPGVHRVVSIIWLVTYLTAIASTLVLIPDISFLLVPPVVCLIGAAATLFVNFVWCGSSRTRKREFLVEDLTFAQISTANSLFPEFCRFYADAIANDPRQAAGDKTVEQVADAVHAAEIAAGDSSHVFVCLSGGRIVGSIRCLVDQRNVPFPTEVDGGFSLDALRRCGRVMAVGRLAVADDFRARPAVLRYLFACFVNLALEHDVQYVLSAGFRHVLPVYMKLGFEFLFDRGDPRHGVRMSHGFVSHPVLLDFAQLIFDRARNNGAKVDFYDVTNKYLAERWFKRALVRQWLGAVFGRDRPRGIAAVRKLLVSEG